MLALIERVGHFGRHDRLLVPLFKGPETLRQFPIRAENALYLGCRKGIVTGVRQIQGLGFEPLGNKWIRWDSRNAGIKSFDERGLEDLPQLPILFRRWL